MVLAAWGQKIDLAYGQISTNKYQRKPLTACSSPMQKIDLTYGWISTNKSQKENRQQLVAIHQYQLLTDINTFKLSCIYWQQLYIHLQFRIASSLAVFQAIIDTIVTPGDSNCFCYLDSILITGSIEETHLVDLEEVLKRLQRYSIWAKQTIVQIKTNITLAKVLNAWQNATCIITCMHQGINHSRFICSMILIK